MCLTNTVQVFDLLMGLYQAADYRRGSQLLKADDAQEKTDFIRTIFEVSLYYLISFFQTTLSFLLGW